MLLRCRAAAACAVITRGYFGAEIANSEYWRDTLSRPLLGAAESIRTTVYGP